MNDDAVRVGIVGAGAIGSVVAAALAAGEITGCVLAGVVRSRSEGTMAVLELARDCDVLVEAAGVGAVGACMAAAEQADCTLVACSTGAFADPGLEAWYRADGHDRVVLPAGAIGGLDLLASLTRSGAGQHVRLTTTKSPAALDVLTDSATVVFRGSSRDAIARFPKTANVGVTLALVTVGLDRTEVVVVADPRATRTRHVVEVDSDLGSYRFEIENATAAGSGARTSALTIWSVVTAIETAALRRRPAHRPRKAIL